MRARTPTCKGFFGGIAIAVTTPQNDSPSSSDRDAALVRLEQIARELTFPALTPREEQALRREEATIRAEL